MLHTTKKLLILIFILALLPITIFALYKIRELRKGAAGQPANIIIDASQPGSNISANLWQNFAQGGEESKDMIAPIINQVRSLQPKIIRIDHLFDHHVKINGNQYDFSQLDGIVKTILQTGAIPMLSLSYMPPSLAKNGNNTSPPNDWNQWRKLIAATVGRYSGKKGLNIYNVYYEVWNEPDLFGKWHYSKEPSYSTLYYHTVSAAQSVTNVNPFKIGGPATTGFYPNWLKAILDYCYKNKLRMDFVSWHRYTKDLQDYEADFEKLNRILTDYPEYFTLERLITEFGPDSENSPWNDNKMSAVHAIAGTTKLLGKVHRVFAFELKDGPDPAGKKYWGRWGLLTHESQEATSKPRYYAYTFLNQLSGKRLPLSGEGSWVSAAAALDQTTIKVLVVNYDKNNQHFEAPPITLQNINPGTYEYKMTYFMGKTSTLRENVTGNEITKKIILEPNSAVILEWKRI